jgi:hypothetical protein
MADGLVLVVLDQACNQGYKVFSSKKSLIIVPEVLEHYVIVCCLLKGPDGVVC